MSRRNGKVYLVGAGPGDPGLITLRGVECLRRADVVLFDYLVNPRILEHVRAGAEKVCLGRHGHGRIWSQAEINEKLVELASQGKRVARLKGGDPAVFARGAEEIDVLVRRDVPFEVVPGITAALAAGSCAGIPITHREMSSAVALITAQENPEKQQPALDYGALARFPGTLVFYMGATTAPQWTSALMQAGKSPDTPAAILRRCSFPDQQSVRCTLGQVVDRLTAPVKMRPPVIVIVGEVVQLSHSISWFETRPLFGQRIMVTRPADQAGALSNPLLELGADVIEQPAIEISDAPDWAPVDAALSRLDEFDWLVFSSANGVKFLLDRLLSTSLDLRSLGGVKLATVGPGTAHELSRYHLKADVQPDEFRAEALAGSLAASATGARFLLARASRGREVLAEQLQAAGGQVEQIVVYTSSDVATPDESARQLLEDGKMDWTTVTSSAIARSLFKMFGAQLLKTKLASISPVTSATLRELGLEPAAEAAEYTMAGIVEAIESF